MEEVWNYRKMWFGNKNIRVRLIDDAIEDYSKLKSRTDKEAKILVKSISREVWKTLKFE